MMVAFSVLFIWKLIVKLQSRVQKQNPYLAKLSPNFDIHLDFHLWLIKFNIRWNFMIMVYAFLCIFTLLTYFQQISFTTFKHKVWTLWLVICPVQLYFYHCKTNLALLCHFLNSLCLPLIFQLFFHLNWQWIQWWSQRETQSHWTVRLHSLFPSLSVISTLE